MCRNFNIDEEDLCLKFEAQKTNWMNQNSDQWNKVEAPFEIIYDIVLTQLQQQQAKSKQTAGKSLGNVNSNIINKNQQALPINSLRVNAINNGSSIGLNGMKNEARYLTDLLTQAKKKSNLNSKQKGGEGKIEQELDQLYISRKSRGNQRLTFNDQITRRTGLQNIGGYFQINVKPIEKFEILNLTSLQRVHGLQKHFDYIENVMKHQLRTETFNDLGETGTDAQRIIGRVVAFNADEEKFSENNVGLINLSEDNQFDTHKMRLNMSEVKSFSLFEGEVIVAEGFIDISTASKFNVTRIHKPMSSIPTSNMGLSEVRDITSQYYRDKHLNIMIASGPFTFKNSLSYKGLQDFLEIVKKEQPQAVILQGPFLDFSNLDIYSGELFYDDIKTMEKVFVTHEELFQDLINQIQNELQELKNTQVIFVPSHKDIHHIQPLPQQPFHPKQFNKMFNQAILAGNPSMVQLNDIRIGIINADFVKEMCQTMIAKNMEPPKIDLSLQAVFQQKLLYPLYPPNHETPIEYSEIQQMMLDQSGTPDILLTSSDLIQFSKNIDGCICINPGQIIKSDAGGTYCSITLEPFDYVQYLSKRIRVEIINI
ncbi:dna polymerase alpha subunit b-like [Stylonychia lemnae]|uniref:DNA polymerase alpha subunit B n=1 Tax=Stylonychia lemnae TaxID=5949 RepID=A0A078A8L1_STYLE|nr:dna polymerase alpha subunit b-like [Stylonychia lemnae]|eukprot:CDW77872.1 dna polymerase alpha subunit b-like [Stylonychia lemnae]